jgi:hypothetical protein
MRSIVRRKSGEDSKALPMTETSIVERQIAERIADAKIHLRFDKSVLRLLNGLKTALANAVPKGQSIVFTVTAPIKRRAKTAALLEALVRDGLPNDDVRDTIEDNHVRVRRVTDVPPEMPKVLVFVHNSEPDADLILEFAESQLRRRHQQRSGTEIS